VLVLLQALLLLRLLPVLVLLQALLRLLTLAVVQMPGWLHLAAE
jgi:hypothetical protein